MVHAKLAFSLLFLLPLLAPAQPDASLAAIRAVLDEQQAAWNRGDVRAFIKGYDESATMVGSAVIKASRRSWNITSPTTRVARRWAH